MGKIKAPKQTEEKILPSDEIIRRSAEKELPGQDINAFMQKMIALVRSKRVQLLQIGNTVFMLQPKGDGSVELHTSTIESPQNLVKRYQAAANSLKQIGYKKVISYATSPAFVKIAEQTGLPVKVEQSQQVIGNKAVPAYKFEVDI